MPTLLRLLDTDVVIDIQKGRAPALAWFATLNISQVAIPGFVVMELYHSARDEREAQSADAIIRPLAVAWPSSSACVRAPADSRALRLSHSLGLDNALIGATARELGRRSAPSTSSAVAPGLTTEQPHMR